MMTDQDAAKLIEMALKGRQLTRQLALGNIQTAWRLDREELAALRGRYAALTRDPLKVQQRSSSTPTQESK